MIVVDDGSADGTDDLVAAIASTDERVELIAQPNQGTAGARNTGIARASAAYVSFLDNDDLWMPRYLEAAGEALDGAPEAAFAYCDAWTLVHSSSRLRRRTELEARPGPEPGASWEQVFVTLAARNFVMSSATVRAGALREVGGFAREIDRHGRLRPLVQAHARGAHRRPRRRHARCCCSGTATTRSRRTT